MIKRIISNIIFWVIREDINEFVYKAIDDKNKYPFYYYKNLYNGIRYNELFELILEQMKCELQLNEHKPIHKLVKIKKEKNNAR